MPERPKADRTPYVRAKIESMARTVQPGSYCCPAKRVITGFAVANSPRVSGNIIIAVYRLARFMPAVMALWSFLPYAMP